MYEKRIVHQVGYLQELNRDARSTEHKLQNDVANRTENKMSPLWDARSTKHKLQNDVANRTENKMSPLWS